MEVVPRATLHGKKKIAEYLARAWDQCFSHALPWLGSGPWSWCRIAYWNEALLSSSSVSNVPLTSIFSAWMYSGFTAFPTIETHRTSLQKTTTRLNNSIPCFCCCYILIFISCLLQINTPDLITERQKSHPHN